MKDRYALANIKKVKWGILEENRPIHLYQTMYPGWCGIIQGTGKILGKYQKNIACLHHRDSGLIFVDHKEWTELGEYALRKIRKNPAWGFELNKKILQYSDELVRFSSRSIFRVAFMKKTNKELYQLYHKYDQLHTKLYNHAIIPVYLDLYKPHLTTYLIEYLNKQVKKVAYPRTAKELFTQLTIPEKLSKVQKEEIALLKITQQVKKSLGKKSFSQKNVSAALQGVIKKHVDQYRYLGFNFEGPALPDQYFWKRLKELVLDGVVPQTKISAITREKRQAAAIHRRLVKELKIDHQHQKLLTITQGFIYSKDYRKMSLVQSYYELEPLYKEMARRLHLSVPEVRNCLVEEVNLMLAGKLKRPVELAQRMRGLLVVVIDGDLPGRIFVDSRNTAMRKYLLKKEDLTEVNYFHGQAACLGKAEGTVRIINSIKDANKMNVGDIMVSQRTFPELVPAMKKAAAIVTDLGGITCHAAIISRELKIPCVIGTKVATKVLQGGDRVVVDANRGDIKKI